MEPKLNQRDIVIRNQWLSSDYIFNAQSSGFNAGVAIQFGNGVSFGVTAGGNYGKGYGNGDETTYTYSHVGDKNSQTTLESSATTNLKGAQVQGKGVKLDAQNLNIESLQETLTYKGKQMNANGQVTVGYGFSASGSYNQSKMNADYASVIEQSGLYTGDDGYQVNVQNHTDLKGGLIISSQTAEDNGNNRFETGTLSYSDITTESAVENSGKLAQNFDKEKVLKELNIQVKVTQDFRKNAFATIDAYVLPKQAELREKIKQAKTEEEKTALYDEIYKLQYQKRLLETVVGIVAGSPELAITQGTLQLAATKMREETLANSRLFKGIKDAKTGDVLRNDSYDSGYFDGVKP
ncbi:MAG: hemagglutinin repeat-containing protein [Actinobacillus porcinus]|nr:hemagglutinin repeat-containing protein [Actinobacillus porcinus]MDD7545985.1 hemagglutinin repeat-containing protein [Actinobacillus porcinus]MDY5421539.1 hemagglutinin repeat-containing protein [Actinobacillus porcinus]MDY5849171.1 hemagglutinin repeat-containing protein [Actinobacillus porcinus]